MKILVKIGGAALEAEETRRRCALAVARLVEDGHHVAVVHGGGSALTNMLQRLGKKSEFVNGLRVTDSETRDIAVMVLSGSVNKQLVAAINATGIPAVGLSGSDGAAFTVRKKYSKVSDLGYVGEIISSDSRWIEAIWAKDGVPVVSPIALGADGQHYNVNADEMAAACAAACRANVLFFLTDVPGVKDAAGAVIANLSIDQIERLIQDDVVSGGMLPKLDACKRALKNGVDRVRILPAAQAEMLHDFYLTKVDCGTEVMVA